MKVFILYNTVCRVFFFSPSLFIAVCEQTVVAKLKPSVIWARGIEGVFARRYITETVNVSPNFKNDKLAEYAIYVGRGAYGNTPLKQIYASISIYVNEKKLLLKF